MPVRPNFDPNHLYFVTTKAEKHTNIFKHEPIIRTLLDSLHYLRVNGRMKLFVFVIMPNHIHFIGKFSREYTLSNVMRDFKRYTARQILRQLKAENNIETLDYLRRLNKDPKQEFKV